MKTASLIIAIIVMTTQFASPTFAQLFGGGGGKINTEFVPPTAFASSVMFPQKLKEEPNFKLVPREVITAWGERELGFDPLLIKQITWVLKTPEDLKFEEGPPVWAAVLHFDELQALNGKLIDQLEEKTIAGRPAYSGAASGNPSFLIVDELTIMASLDESFMEEMLVDQSTSPLVELMKKSKVKGQVQAFVDVQAIRPVVQGFLDELGDLQMPPQMMGLLRTHDLLKGVEFGIDVDGTLESKMVMHANNKEDAEEYEQILIEGIRFAKELIIAQVAGGVNQNDPVQAASVQYAARIGNKYEKRLTPKRNGTDLTINMEEEILALPYVMSMGAYIDASQFNPDSRKQNQLRQTALAIHNYESAYRKFPTRTVKSEDGKDLFSGRAAILPFIEQNTLYSQLRLDEPWDSTHNSQFTQDMKVAQFSDPDGDMVRFPVFPNSMWDDENPVEGFGDITDGTSNTIMAIHAPVDDSYSWADPAPWKISADDPMSSIFGDREFVLAVFADGSTHRLEKEDMTNEKLTALLTVGGGEIIER